MVFVLGVEAKGEKANAKVNLGQSNKEERQVEIQAHGNRLTVTEDSEITEVEEYEVDGEEEGAEDDVLIKAENNAALVIRNKLEAETKFPLRVNLDTNELIVITPKGEKIVTVLPDKAVQNMLAAKVLDQIGGKAGYLWLRDQAATPSASPVASATPSASPTSSPTATAEATPVPEAEPDVELTVNDYGDLVYAIKGEKSENLLRIIKIKIKRVAIVSAETGRLLEIREDFLNRILDFLSS